MNLVDRRRLRLRLRDLAAGSAFSAVALSGALPTIVTGLFGVSFAVSMWGRRPFSNQRVWSVLADESKSAGQVPAAPVQSSATSQDPAAERQTVLEDESKSAGQIPAAPEQVSCRSHTPALDRQTMPLVSN